MPLLLVKLVRASRIERLKQNWSETAGWRGEGGGVEGLSKGLSAGGKWRLGVRTNRRVNEYFGRSRFPPVSINVVLVSLGIFL